MAAVIFCVSATWLLGSCSATIGSLVKPMKTGFAKPFGVARRYENPSTAAAAGESKPSRRASPVAGASISVSSFSSGLPSPAAMPAGAPPGRLRP